jgi:hypothetical protein
MAEGVTINVDATRALVKLDRITPAVRDELRGIIPSLTNRLGALVDSKLGSELKSRTTLTVAKEMHETTAEIYGLVELRSPSANGLLPTYLELGTRAHPIVGNPILAFYWERLGKMVFFHSVNHPGFKAYAFMARSFAEMRDEIVEQLKAAAQRGASKAQP